MLFLWLYRQKRSFRQNRSSLVFSGNFHHTSLFLFFFLPWPHFPVLNSFISSPSSVFKGPSTQHSVFEFHSICVKRAFKGRTNLFLSFLLTLRSELGSQAIDFCLCIVLIYCSLVIFQMDKGPITDSGFPHLINRQLNSLGQKIDDSHKSTLESKKNMSSSPLTKGPVDPSPK